LLGILDRQPGGAELAGAPLLERDRLPARREQVLELVAGHVALEPGEVDRGLLARLQRAVAIAGVRGEELRADLGVRRPQVRGLVALRRERPEQLAGGVGLAGIELRDRERELERERLGALEDALIARRALEVRRGLAGL